ncbi:MAG: class I SAM-dependent methyltransferase [Elusimicrobia bacterium]|nr:class I SAM-dependent methyltransferase [Elusimicrobiota bacterium]
MLFGQGINRKVCPWWLTYSFDNPLRRLIHQPEKMFAGLIKPGDNVMDIGCGFGYFSSALAKMTGINGQVIAVDLQEKSLNIVLKRAQKKQVAKWLSVHLATTTGIHYNGQVDFALSFWMAHEVPDQAPFFKEIVSLLKPGAKYLLSEPILHVSKTAYDKTIEQAVASGLKPIRDLNIAISRAKLFTV